MKKLGSQAAAESKAELRRPCGAAVSGDDSGREEDRVEVWVQEASGDRNACALACYWIPIECPCVSWKQ